MDIEWETEGSARERVQDHPNSVRKAYLPPVCLVDGGSAADECPWVHLEEHESYPPDRLGDGNADDEPEHHDPRDGQEHDAVQQPIVELFVEAGHLALPGVLQPLLVAMLRRAHACLPEPFGALLVPLAELALGGDGLARLAFHDAFAVEFDLLADLGGRQLVLLQEGREGARGQRIERREGRANVRPELALHELRPDAWWWW